MAAKKNKTHLGRCRKALLLRQISPAEFREMVHWDDGLEIGQGNRLVRFVPEGFGWKQRFIRKLETGTR